jgi:hypothetical protein
MPLNITINLPDFSADQATVAGICGAKGWMGDTASGLGADWPLPSAPRMARLVFETVRREIAQANHVQADRINLTASLSQP